ncbi:hypothetical protein HKD37_12G033983 [Glycine soja]
MFSILTFYELMLNPTQFQAKEDKVQVANDSLSEADPINKWHPLSEAYNSLSGEPSKAERSKSLYNTEVGRILSRSALFEEQKTEREQQRELRLEEVKFRLFIIFLCQPYKGLSNPRFVLGESSISKGSLNPRSTLGESRISKGSSNRRSALGETCFYKGSSNSRSALGSSNLRSALGESHLSKSSSNPRSSLGKSRFSKGSSNPRSFLWEFHIFKGSSNLRSIFGESRFSKGSSNPRSTLVESRFSKGSSNPRSSLGESRISKGSTNLMFSLGEPRQTAGQTYPMNLRNTRNPKSALGMHSYKNPRFLKAKGNTTRLVSKTFNQVKIKLSPHWSQMSISYKIAKAWFLRFQDLTLIKVTYPYYHKQRSNA